MNVSSEKPPIWDRAQAAFDLDWDSGVVVTYGDTAYCKSGQLSPDLRVHEETHVMQQKVLGPERFFDKYLIDPSFRMQMETEAYQRQAAFIRRTIRDRNKVTRMIHHLATSMASMYGDMCTYQEAQRLLALAPAPMATAPKRTAPLPWYRRVLKRILPA